ncbi:hypothetical protein [Frisingicoccus sp.]|uniref:hypothetical protein n=1 Tax=Frisingicoccus sp. TaxID=1918627 RepID=UPI003AB60416
MGLLIYFLLMVMMPFGGEIAFGIFSLIALYDIITWLRPPKSWGALRFFTRYTLKVKVGLTVLAGAVVLSFIQEAYIDGWGTAMSIKAGAFLLLMVSSYLPARVYENGFRYGWQFSPWSSVETMEADDNYRVKITLKNPNIQRKTYLNLGTEEEFRMLCGNAVKG